MENSNGLASTSEIQMRRVFVLCRPIYTKHRRHASLAIIVITDGLLVIDSGSYTDFRPGIPWQLGTIGLSLPNGLWYEEADFQERI